jgi:hypothetical protein
MSGLGVQELLLIGLIFAPFMIVLTSLIDILKNEFNGNNKVVWVLVVLLFPIAGSLLYFIIGRNQRL